jgi:hypothetical protein
MNNKSLKYILYILCSMAIVMICINGIFNGLHDYGQIGMVVGLIVSPIILIPTIYKMKWWIKLILIITLILIPFPLAKIISRFLYSFQEEGSVSSILDLIGYILFFIFSFILIEFGLALNKKFQNLDN